MRTFLLTTDSLYYPPLTLISILFHKETISKCADERIKFYSSSVNRRNLLNNGQYTFVRVCVNRQPPKCNDYKRKKMLNYCFLQSDCVIMVRLNFRWLGIQQCLRFMRTLMFPMLSECSSFCWIMLNWMRNGIIWKYEFGKGIWSITIICILCSVQI